MFLATMSISLTTIILALGASLAIAAYVTSERIPTPQDDSLLLQDTVTQTASTNSAALSLGTGFNPGGLGMTAAAVIDVSAMDLTSGNETYTFTLQESADGSTGWAAIGVAKSATATGVIMAKGIITQPYVRLAMVAAGTTPSVTYKAWLNPIVRG